MRLLTALLATSPIATPAGVFFWVGGTPQAEFDAARNGGKPLVAHHSPFFHVEAKPSATRGAKAMVVAALDLLKK